MSDPSVQLIANLVVTRADGRVLLVQYDPAHESSDADADLRWWLPGHQLEAYQHPDEAARTALADLDGIEASAVTLTRVQSFRGRRGWHVSFDYRVDAAGEPSQRSIPARWCDPEDLPRTMHGSWEGTTIAGVLSA